MRSVNQVFADGWNLQIRNQRQALQDSLDLTDRQWRQITHKTKDGVGEVVHGVKTGYDAAAAAAGVGLGKLQAETNAALSALGVAHKVDFAVAAAAQGATGGHHGGHGGRGLKEGGLAAVVPGFSPGDHHTLSLGGVPIAKVASKEGIFVGNPNMMSTLGALNGMFPASFAGGGGMQPGISDLIHRVIEQFGGSMSSGYRPGDPGFHGRGLAADWVGGNWTGASKFVNSIGPQLLEGIHQAPPGVNVSWDSGHQVSPSFWGSSTWAAHVSHIHMAIDHLLRGGARGGSFVGSAPDLKRILVQGADGAIKTAAQAALDRDWHAATQYVQSHASTGAMGVSVPTGPIQTMARQMVNQMWGPGQFGPFAQLEMQEAGWNPRALNPSSGAAGLAQALPASKYPPGAWPYHGLESAKLQLQWMMGYIRDRYGSPAGAWAHEQSAGWYGRGGRLRPGETGVVGERGMELAVGRHDGGADVVSRDALRKVGRPVVHVHVDPAMAYLRNFIRVESEGVVSEQLDHEDHLASMGG
jgi:hypothetical protein